MPGLLSHSDVVGVGVARGGAGRHGALACRVIGHGAGTGRVSGEELLHSAIASFVHLCLHFSWHIFCDAYIGKVPTWHVGVIFPDYVGNYIKNKTGEAERKNNCLL